MISFNRDTLYTRRSSFPGNLRTDDNLKMILGKILAGFEDGICIDTRETNVYGFGKENRRWRILGLRLRFESMKGWK